MSSAFLLNAEKASDVYPCLKSSSLSIQSCTPQGQKSGYAGEIVRQEYEQNKEEGVKLLINSALQSWSDRGSE